MGKHFDLDTLTKEAIKDLGERTKPLSEEEKKLVAAFYIGQLQGIQKSIMMLDEWSSKIDDADDAMAVLKAFAEKSKETTTACRQRLSIRQKPVREALESAMAYVIAQTQALSGSDSDEDDE